MKGDFSRFTNKYYNRVLKQQGRADLDSDWNEYVEGREYADRKKTKDIIGDCGVPTEDAGFAITSKNDFSRHLRAVQFQSAGRGWAVATNGAILATTDGGRTWFAQESGVSDWLDGLYFVDGLIGWAVGQPGVILATQNGGDTWETQASGVTNVLHAVHFVNDLHGWAVGAGGTILATVDGGREWLRKTSDTTEDLLSVYFVDEKTGWAVGKQGVVLNTTDSGVSWLEQASGVDVDLHSVRFVKESLGWSVGISGVILHTTDKGRVWTKQASGTESPLFDVCFTDELTGWVVGTTGLILHTTTGGSSWTEQESSVAKKHLWAVHFLDERIGWAVGDRETIIGTEDGGLTWEHVSLNLGIGKGRAYINGILCEAEQEVTYITQPSYPDPPSIHPLTAIQTTRTDLVYLDVWQRHITAIEDPIIREVALGGPDTATRVKTLWQVKIKKDVEEDTACNADIAGWPPADTGARLSTKAEPEAIEQKPCTVPLGAGYSGLENRLYRIEIHDEGEPYTWPRPDIPDSALLEAKILDPNNQRIILAKPLELVSEWLGRMVEVFSPKQNNQPGPTGRIIAVEDDQQTLTVDTVFSELAKHMEIKIRKVATFKWSRDNGSVAFAIDEFKTEDSQPTNKVKIRGFGQDPALALKVGDWVEISDDASELNGYPGTIAQIKDPVDSASGIVTLDRPVSGYSAKRHPKLRRWDQQTEIIPITGDWQNLKEEGIDIQLSESNFKTGDYWTFSARVNNGHIDELNKEPPHGIEHYYCPLALVRHGFGTAEIEDCRKTFSPLTELATDFPYIKAINWEHNREYNENQIEELCEILQKQTITFDKDINKETINHKTLYVIVTEYIIDDYPGYGYFEHELSKTYSPIAFQNEEDENKVSFYQILMNAIICTGYIPATYHMANTKIQLVFESLIPKILEEALDGGFRFFIRLKGDFVQDKNGKPLDANHIKGELPTGNGIPGGLFESWFDFKIHYSNVYDTKKAVNNNPGINADQVSEDTNLPLKTIQFFLNTLSNTNYIYFKED